MYCGRLDLSVPIAVSAKSREMADVFHIICRTAINPCVSLTCVSTSCVNLAVIDAAFLIPSLSSAPLRRYFPHNAFPGGADRVMSIAARFKSYATIGAVLGGITTLSLVIYRTFSRPGAFGPGWFGQWASWLFGTARREL